LAALLDYLNSQPALGWLVFVFLGLVAGSFLNVVIHRLPLMMLKGWRSEARAILEDDTPVPEGRYDLLVPRSRCPRCETPVTALQNIPVVSYLLMGGRCRRCRAPISVRYPLVELGGAAVALLAFGRFGASPEAFAACLYGWALLALAGVDLDQHLLPDDITLPLLWLGLLVNLSAMFAPLPSAVIGAITGYLVLWGVYQAFRLLTGKEGMGYGDFKLLAAIGAWLGWQALPLVILLSSLVGASVGIAMIALGRHGRDAPIPFGPYLAAAGLLAMYAGEAINERYLRLLL